MHCAPSNIKIYIYENIQNQIAGNQNFWFGDGNVRCALPVLVYPFAADKEKKEILKSVDCLWLFLNTTTLQHITVRERKFELHRQTYIYIYTHILLLPPPKQTTKQKKKGSIHIR